MLHAAAVAVKQVRFSLLPEVGETRLSRQLLEYYFK